MPINHPPYSATTLQTGQTTCYVRGDDGDRQRGWAKRYDVSTTGSYAGTTNIDSPGYAAATIAFVSATKKITDSAGGLAYFKTNDIIRVRGSAANDGVYTIATGNVAGEIVVVEALADELAGAYVTLCKREAHSNNCVYDLSTGLMWSRYVSASVGPASDGKLAWQDTTKNYTLHPAAADLAIVAPNILRVTGSDESTRYFAGMRIVCAGFANANNNLAFDVVSVSVVAGNTDIVVNPSNQALTAEAAGGSRSIKVVCASIFSYCASANIAALAGHTDWRVPNAFELYSLGVGSVDGTAFPSLGTTQMWSSTFAEGTSSVISRFASRVVSYADKTSAYKVLLVRG